jgi:branched-chain amino acid transport system permease protein
MGGQAWVRILDFAILYVFLALGLNIVVGFAGLLDLGYIAFYAVGAYTWALLASPHFGLHCRSGPSCPSVPGWPASPASCSARRR